MNQNNSKSVSSESPYGYPNKTRAMISPTSGSIPIGSYALQQNFHSLSPAAQRPFGSPISKIHFPSDPQYYSRTSCNGNPLTMPPVPTFNNPSPPLLWHCQQQIHFSPQHRGFMIPNYGSPLPMHSGPRFNTLSQPSPLQSGLQCWEFYNSSNERPASMTPDPRFSSTVCNDTFFSQKPHSLFNPASNMASFGSPEIHSQQRQHYDQSGSQRRCISSWLDPRSSPGGRGSSRSEPHASGSPQGGSWSEPRGRSSNDRGLGGSPSLDQVQGASWSEPRERGSGGRGLGVFPSSDQIQGDWESRVHASAPRKQDIFVKKSQVEDPWKTLVPIQMDSVVKAHKFGRRGIFFNLDYSDSCQSESISLKKPKTSQIKDDIRSELSLAESLALSFPMLSERNPATD